MRCPVCADLRKAIRRKLITLILFIQGRHADCRKCQGGPDGGHRLIYDAKLTNFINLCNKNKLFNTKMSNLLIFVTLDAFNLSTIVIIPNDCKTHDD